jgi:methyl-accepting chemotaxis protein
MQKKYVKWTYLFVLLLVTGGLYFKRQQEIQKEIQSFKHIQSQKYRSMQKNLTQKMEQMYQAIRTISLLPGVRSIDRYGKNLDKNTKITIQQIYNNAYLNIRLSELYLLPRGFDPSHTDKLTKKSEEPIITFDEFIIAAKSDNKDDSGTEAPPTMEEVETEEYKLMAIQLDYFEKNFQTSKSFNELNVPAITGPVVITCDNSDFTINDLKNKNDEPRNGLVYTVPIYNNSGQLHGAVSAVVRTRILESYLENGVTALANTKHAIWISNQASENLSKYRRTSELGAKNDLLYAETLPIQLPDGSAWSLQVALDNSIFYNSAEFISGQRSFWLSSGILFLIFFAVSYIRLKNQKVFSFLDMATLELNQKADGLNQCSDRILQRASSLDQISNSGASAIHQTAAATEEMLRMMESNNDNMEKSKSSIDGSLQEISHGQESVSQLKEALSVISQSKTGLTEIMSIFERIVKQIKVINTIVMETRLLSFNASIEAARAGQHGKGFSVVAEEIGKLALQSGTAADEINKLLDHSSKRIDNVVRDINSNINRGDSIFKEFQKGLDHINLGFEQIAKSFQVVSRSTAQQIDAVKQVNEAIHALQKNSHDIQNLSGELKSESGILITTSQELGENVVGIKKFFNANKNSDI